MRQEKQNCPKNVKEKRNCPKEAPQLFWILYLVMIELISDLVLFRILDRTHYFSIFLIAFCFRDLVTFFTSDIVTFSTQ